MVKQEHNKSLYFRHENNSYIAIAIAELYSAAIWLHAGIYQGQKSILKFFAWKYSLYRTSFSYFSLAAIYTYAQTGKKQS